jgi:hypothetical protein
MNNTTKSGARRVKVAYITPQMLADLLSQNITIRIETRLPETVRVAGAYFDNERASYGIIFEDESFEEVPAGEAVPLLREPCVFKRVEEPENTMSYVDCGGHSIPRPGEMLPDHVQAELLKLRDEYPAPGEATP